MYVDFQLLNRPDSYRTVIQTIIPRPVAWVLSEIDHSVLDADGRVRADRVDPLARLGRGRYCTLGEIITVLRPR